LFRWLPADLITSINEDSARQVSLGFGLCVVTTGASLIIA
jgi:hypothetical protein